MGDSFITVEHLSKRYLLSHQRSKADGLRHKIEDFARTPWRFFRQRILLDSRRATRDCSPSAADPAGVTREVFWALRNVSFEVRQGEVVGIIGRNGAGKSTLLKVLRRITEPTAGRVLLKGRVASLLEVGTGFHPELTGRENIYLNGAILGMTRQEMKRKFDEIVAFSEIEKFLDTPVKRYSSGMYVRLAFAVAAHLEPEILIVDEVLAVGDAGFQNKCLGKMSDVSRSGRTVLFVSHNMQAVAALCHRALLLEQGQVVERGTARDLAALYLAREGREHALDPLPLDQKPRTGTGAARFTAMTVRRAPGPPRAPESLVPGDTVEATLEVTAGAAIQQCNLALTVYDSNATRLIDVNTALKGEFLSLQPGEKATVTFVLHDLLLKPGRYLIELWLGRGGIEDIDFVREAGYFDIREDLAASRHTETFPGIYRCRFTHQIVK